MYTLISVKTLRYERYMPNYQEDTIGWFILLLQNRYSSFDFKLKQKKTFNSSEFTYDVYSHTAVNVLYITIYSIENKHSLWKRPTWNDQKLNIFKYRYPEWAMEKRIWHLSKISEFYVLLLLTPGMGVCWIKI